MRHPLHERFGWKLMGVHQLLHDPVLPDWRKWLYRLGVRLFNDGWNPRNWR